MDVSCYFAPQPDTPGHIELAEKLGYKRALCFDSPAMCFDVWMTLARAAERTSVIGLAPGVMVPALRDVVVNASALLTLHQLAPGRVALAVGTGATGTRMLDLKQMSWAPVVGYMRAIKALLRGEEIEWEGRTLQLSYPSAYAGKAAPLPLDIPVLFATEGPKGREMAALAGADGICTAGEPPEGFPWILRILTGTVLDEGESPISERVRAAAGPAAALVYHVSYEYGGAAAVEQLPDGSAWVKSLEAKPKSRWHLERWHGHLVELNAHDEAHLQPDVIPVLSTVREAPGMRDLMAEWADQGVTEIGFVPAGDIDSELRRMAAALRLEPRP